MNLPKKELLKGCNDRLGMEILVNQAESVLRTWKPTWSSFISAPLREEALKIMAPLNNLYWQSDGGYPGAELQRMQCIRYEDEIPICMESAPISGLHIEGNFLFDRASPKDFRNALEQIGVPKGGLGDIWINGDRGAQAICIPETAMFLDRKTSSVRDVTIKCESVPIKELRLPIHRLSKHLRTVEASTRLDAIASAGFGLSRGKVVNQIKAGKLRLNWKPIKQASKELIIGDRIQLEDRGSLEVINIELTKRHRWRVELLRH